MTKICKICGQSFDCPSSSKKVTCSKECSKINKSKTHKGKHNQWSNTAKKQLSQKGATINLSLGTKAAIKSPNSGSFETNVNALIWILKSPENKVIEIKNLNLWAKNNVELFGESAKNFNRISGGIRMLKRSAEGKLFRKDGAPYSVNYYKGWSYIDSYKNNKL